MLKSEASPVDFQGLGGQTGAGLPSLGRFPGAATEHEGRAQHDRVAYLHWPSLRLLDAAPATRDGGPAGMPSPVEQGANCSRSFRKVDSFQGLVPRIGIFRCWSVGRRALSGVWPPKLDGSPPFSVPALAPVDDLEAHARRSAARKEDGLTCS